MNHLIKGKRAFITGASSGIGKACAEHFAKIGVNLIITARRLDRLQKLADELSSQHGIECIPLELDVQNAQSVEAVFKKLEKDKVEIDILVNNAGLGLSLDKLQDGDVNNWDLMIDTNIKGLLYATRFALPSMIKRNTGHIINMGSVAGRSCYPGGNIYSATKFAVKALSQSLRIDLLGTAIRVSEIAPGAVETEFSAVRFNSQERADKVYEGFQPLTGDDIADAVIYCATRLPHVNVSEIVIYPQAQASPTALHRQAPTN